jgi:hypothetical protein
MLIFIKDAWFRPSMSRVEVTDTLTNAEIGEFIIRSVVEFG